MLRPPGVFASRSPAPIQMGFGGRREVGGATDQPRIVRRNRVEHLAARLPRRQPFGIGRESRQIGVPAIRQFASLHRLDLLCQVGKFTPVGLEQLAPGLVEFAAAPANALREVLAHAVRHEKFGVLRPAVVFLGEPHLVFAQRLAVSGAGILLVRCAIADVAVHHDQGRRDRWSCGIRPAASQDRPCHWHPPDDALSSHTLGSARPTSSLNASAVFPSMLMLL